MPQTQRRQPKQARSRDLVDRILTSAGELFAGRGFPNVTTNHIAEHAGVSIGSLYQFFADKDEILAALQDKWTERLRAELDLRLRPEPGVTLAETVEQVLEVHATLNRQPPGLLGFLLISTAHTDHSNALIAATPTPVIALNRAVAVGMAGDLRAGLALLDALAGDGELDGYHLLWAARADLRRRLGDVPQARRDYERALGLTQSEPERRFLARRLHELGGA